MATAVHYRRPPERPFLAAERDRTTILFGGLTTRHERLLQAAFEQAGYRAERLPVPDRAALEIGKEYGNAGQCNPAHFTVGSLIQYLRQLEARGLTRREICDRYVYVTAGSCGPCRFGMYEAEYRHVLRSAGYEGFRVVLFQQDRGLKQEERGLRYTLDFGFNVAKALMLGDALGELAYKIRPYEVSAGVTDATLEAVLGPLAQYLRHAGATDLLDRLPGPLGRRLSRWAPLRHVANSLGRYVQHFYSQALRDVLAAARQQLRLIEVDRTQVKPVVKIIGEFWAQTTEGDGNYRVFAFLEREGAEVIVDPIGTWVTYLLYCAEQRVDEQRGFFGPETLSGWVRPGTWLRPAIRRARWRVLCRLGEHLYRRQYVRILRGLGGWGDGLVAQAELARLAHPFYHSRARGGEGHLEVAKSIYYTLHRRAHLILSLKPFGCMPSSQSDGVHAAVVERYPEMLFVSVETAGEGEINALSRIEMGLAEARARARAEFDRVLAETGKRLEDVRAFVAAHPVLRSALYPVPRFPGIAGTAANFVRHVSDLMDGRARLRSVR